MALGYVFSVIYFIASLLLPTNTVYAMEELRSAHNLVSFGIAPNIFGSDHWKAVYVNASRKGER